MRVERGASQILFGLLPGQTADLEGRIWRVANWVDPVQTALDPDTVRSALIAAIAPWAATGNDDGLTAELRARTTVDIVRLNMDRGVLVEPFPQQWRCKTCGTITRTRDKSAMLHEMQHSATSRSSVTRSVAFQAVRHGPADAVRSR